MQATYYACIYNDKNLYNEFTLLSHTFRQLWHIKIVYLDCLKA